MQSVDLLKGYMGIGDLCVSAGVQVMGLQCLNTGGLAVGSVLEVTAES